MILEAVAAKTFYYDFFCYMVFNVYYLYTHMPDALKCTADCIFCQLSFMYIFESIL